jgi:hypothetical protein
VKLTDAQRRLIISRIESLFESTKAGLLGKLFKGPKIYFEVVKRTDPLHTIEGIYMYTLKMLYGPDAKPNVSNIKNLAEITSDYLDSQQLKVKNHILADVAKAKTPSEAIRYIRNHFDKAGEYVDMLVANEAHIVQAYASREGITRLASDIKVKDPTVVFLGIADHKICKYCKSMYHDRSNLQVPKPYRLSQVREGYFKPKEWDGKTPHQSPLHPHCRHIMAFVPPNFGYDKSGTIVFKAIGYDYYEDYWSVRKSEEPTSADTPMPNFISYDEYLEINIEHEKEHVLSKSSGNTCTLGCKHEP